MNHVRKEKIAFQVACHLGESGILSAAGRALSLLCKDAVYYDGSYDKYLLTDNVTNENVSFAHGGLAGPLKGSGLGVDINRIHLEQMCTRKIALSRP